MTNDHKLMLSLVGGVLLTLLLIYVSGPLRLFTLGLCALGLIGVVVEHFSRK